MADEETNLVLDLLREYADWVGPNGHRLDPHQMAVLREHIDNLESQLTASRERVRELERVIGRNVSELFRVYERAETAERERDEALRERDALLEGRDDGK